MAPRTEGKKWTGKSPLVHPSEPSTSAPTSGSDDEFVGSSTRIGFNPYHSNSVPKSENLQARHQQQSSKSHTQTTMMLRNIPNKYTQNTLMQELNDNGFTGTYDFFYLPMDIHNRSNVGYAFINFENSRHAERFQREFAEHRFQRFHSRKIGSVCVAHVQGLDENLRHFENRAVTQARNDQYRPVILQGSRRLPFEEAMARALGKVSAPSAQKHKQSGKQQPQQQHVQQQHYMHQQPQQHMQQQARAMKQPQQLQQPQQPKQPVVMDAEVDDDTGDTRNALEASIFELLSRMSTPGDDLCRMSTPGDDFCAGDAPPGLGGYPSDAQDATQDVDVATLLSLKNELSESIQRRSLPPPPGLSSTMHDKMDPGSDCDTHIGFDTDSISAMGNFSRSCTETITRDGDPFSRHSSP